MIIWKLHNWLRMSLQPSAQKCGCLRAKNIDLFSIHRLDRFGHIKALVKTASRWKAPIFGIRDWQNGGW